MVAQIDHLVPKEPEHLCSKSYSCCWVREADPVRPWLFLLIVRHSLMLAFGS